MPDLRTLVLIPESTRKRPGGVPVDSPEDRVAGSLARTDRSRLLALREEVERSTPSLVDARGLLPAYRRFDGNMYRHIPMEAWEGRDPGVEVLIVSGLRGLVGSRDPIPAYKHSMAEPTPPFGKLNRWWHGKGLPGILAAYVRAVRPRTVVDLLSLEYRDAVTGYESDLEGVARVPIDFPGLGRASQPRRGERVAEILRRGGP